MDIPTPRRLAPVATGSPGPGRTAEGRPQPYVPLEPPPALLLALPLGSAPPPTGLLASAQLALEAGGIPGAGWGAEQHPWAPSPCRGCPGSQPGCGPCLGVVAAPQGVPPQPEPRAQDGWQGESSPRGDWPQKQKPLWFGDAWTGLFPPRGAPEAPPQTLDGLPGDGRALLMLSRDEDNTRQEYSGMFREHRVPFSGSSEQLSGTTATGIPPAPPQADLPPRTRQVQSRLHQGTADRGHPGSSLCPSPWVTEAAAEA